MLMGFQLQQNMGNSTAGLLKANAKDGPSGAAKTPWISGINSFFLGNSHTVNAVFGSTVSSGKEVSAVHQHLTATAQGVPPGASPAKRNFGE
jgi:hypothetical protein